jgi:Kef-type K+ transport system membrane component KefB
MEHFFFDLSVLLACVGVLSCVAVIFRQPIIIAYILTGVVIGPWGAGLIKHVEFLEVISRLGITLLLFLAGLNLPVQKLLHIFRKTALVTLSNCAVSFALAFGTAFLFRFSLIESMCIGLAMMFSSTILAVKLLPTMELHHTRIGAACIGVLILQDLLAIAVLAFIRCLQTPGPAFIHFFVLSLKLAAFIAVLFVFEFYVLRKAMSHVDRLQEVIFILGLGWCFGIASLSHQAGLFYETGAFFAGVVLTSHRISLFISGRIKPLRDFFLVLFFSRWEPRLMCLRSAA